LKSGSLTLQEPSEPVQAYKGIALTLVEKLRQSYLLAGVREAGIIVNIILFWNLLLSKGVGVKLYEERASEEEAVGNSMHKDL
jgi:hypothetical protein